VYQCIIFLIVRLAETGGAVIQKGEFDCLVSANLSISVVCRLVIIHDAYFREHTHVTSRKSEALTFICKEASGSEGLGRRLP